MSADLLVYALALAGALACRGRVFVAGTDLRRSAERWNGWGRLTGAPSRATSGALWGALSRKEAIVWALNAFALATLVALAAWPSLARNAVTLRAVAWVATSVAAMLAAGVLLRASMIWRRHHSTRWVGVLPVAAGLLFVSGLCAVRMLDTTRVRPPLLAVDGLWFAGSVAFLVVFPFLDARLDRRWSSRLFAHAVPRELCALCAAATLPFAGVFVPSAAGRIVVGTGLLAVAATAWRPGQIPRLRVLPFAVIAAHAAGRSLTLAPKLAGGLLAAASAAPSSANALAEAAALAGSGAAAGAVSAARAGAAALASSTIPAGAAAGVVNAALAGGTGLAAGHLVIAMAYLVYAAGALERTRAYLRIGQAPLRDRLAGAPTFDAGSVEISVMPGSTPDTEGTTVRVHGLVDGADVELLRFDCLDVDAHFHYDPDGRDLQHPLDARDAGEAIESTVVHLEQDLARMLAEAGYGRLADRLDERRLHEQIPTIRAAMHAARLR